MKQILKKQCEDWISMHLKNSKDFHWRKHQLETIIDSLENILMNEDDENKRKTTTIISAPTGAGKSLTLMVIAGVLAEYYNLESYILCSDLSLFKQYEDYIKENDFDNIKCIKGQQNYTCPMLPRHASHQHQQDRSVQNGVCRQNNISWERLMNSQVANNIGYHCANSCIYINERKACKGAPVVVTTYQNYFCTVSSGLNGFNNHHVVLCDECHNIPSLIQAKFTVTISTVNMDRLYSLINKLTAINDERFQELVRTLFPNTNDIDRMKEQLYLVIYNIIQCPYTETANIGQATTELINLLDKYFVPFVDLFHNTDPTILQHDNIQNLGTAINQFALYKESLDAFLQIVSATEEAHQYIVKQPIIYEEPNKQGVTLQSAKEDYIISHYLLDTATHFVFASATPGDIDTYIRNMGIDEENNTVRILQVPSTFDFTNSPIHCFTQYKMSYKEKQKSLPSILHMVEELLKSFKGYHGMIQTGNYETMNYIINNISHKYRARLVYYNNSMEKRAVLEDFEQTDNDKVLIGPTLYEGINLPGDNCRFVIITKIPYPNMSDLLVKRKMELFPGWMQSQAMNNIVQGIGRGIRYDGDWCSTFILDGCFKQLYNNSRKQFPSGWKDRMKFY